MLEGVKSNLSGRPSFQARRQLSNAVNSGNGGHTTAEDVVFARSITLLTSPNICTILINCCEIPINDSFAIRSPPTETLLNFGSRIIIHSGMLGGAESISALWSPWGRLVPAVANLHT